MAQEASSSSADGETRANRRFMREGVSKLHSIVEVGLRVRIAGLDCESASAISLQDRLSNWLIFDCWRFCMAVRQTSSGSRSLVRLSVSELCYRKKAI